MQNLLIGAVSTNYNISDIKRWVETSSWDNCDRVLLVYKTHHTDQISEYLLENNIEVIYPDFNFMGETVSEFLADTGRCDLTTSYELVHNIRFLHIWTFLQEEEFDKVLITDVRDVYFNRNPFDTLKSDKLTATSEEVIYKNHGWNLEHLHSNLGVIGNEMLSLLPVYNVGVFGGSYYLVRSLCADIYLMSVGKEKVADQTSFNYLIQTRYLMDTEFTDLSHKFAVHLHVINEGVVPFNLHNIPTYDIVHQYDRLPNNGDLYK
jgi:hypothetical protein